VAVVDERYDTAPPDQGGSYGRTPPQDLAAEQSVLGGMLLSKDAIADVVESLRSADFYKPAHALVYDAILDLYSRGEPADPITVAAELDRAGSLSRVGGSVYLHTLVSMVPTAANASYYAQIVAEKAILRRLVDAGTRIVRLGYGGGDGSPGSGEIDEIVDRAEREIYEVTERRTSEDYVVLEELLQPTMDEIDAIASRGGISTGVPTGFIALDELTNGLHPGQMVIVAARPGIGKALALDTVLPTPTGWTTMGAVAVGDELLGADGRPVRVVAATEVMAGRPCYEVEFSGGEVIVADAEHQWLTDTRASRKSAQAAAVGYNGYRSQRTFPAVHTTAEIGATLRCHTGDRRLNHSVALAQPLELPDAELPVPPYAFGVWLGDGHSDGARFTSADPEIAVHIEAEGLWAPHLGGMSYGLQLPARAAVEQRACVVCGQWFTPQQIQVKTCGRVCGARSQHLSEPMPPPVCPICGRPSSGWRDGRCASCWKERGSVQAILRTMGVLGNKHVLAGYLRASIAQRRALLAGLLDTDGTVSPGGVIQFATTNAALARDVAELIVGLGYRASTMTKRVKGRTEESSTCFTINFSTDDDVFRLERKRLAQKERCRTASPARRNSRFIVDVRQVASVPVRCVQVDAADHLYLAGRSMIPTHNSTLALDWARNAAVKHHMAAVIFSLEMSRSEITMRLLSAEAEIKLAAMRSGRMGDLEWQKIVRRMGEISDAPLYIDDSPNMTMMEIRAKARRLKQRHDLKLIVVDYLQLMTSSKRVESRQQEVSEISRQMKLLAKELEVPVVAISQLNRGPEQRNDKRPMLADLRESGSLEQDADMVILVHRPDAWEADDPRAGEADLIVAKHRNGPTTTVTVAHQLHYSRFKDLAAM